MIMSFVSLTVITLIILGLTRSSFFKSRYSLTVFSSILAITLLFSSLSLPALAQTQIAAMAASDSTVSTDETDLKLTPGGNQYTGLEYAENTKRNERPVNDSVIKKSIQSIADDDVVVAVASGSVRLTGKVHDQKKAEDLIAKIKKIPGVHEITYDLGLENPS